MVPIPSCPNGFCQFPGVAPDGGEAYFIVSKQSLLGHYRNTHNRRKQLEGLLVPEVLASPAGIWLDLKSVGKTDWMCYAGIPAGRFIRDLSIEAPVPADKVLAVYIQGRRATAGQLVIDSWEWVEEEPQTRGLPIDYETRYGKRLWTPG